MSTADPRHWLRFGVVAAALLIAGGLLGCGPAEEAAAETTPEAEPEPQVETTPEPEAPPPETEAPVCHPAAEVTGAAITGVIYYDEDLNDESAFAMGLEPETDTPIAERSVTLLGVAGERQAVTCEEGDFGFSDLEDGVYVVAPDKPNKVQPCASKNCPRGFLDAVRTGHVKIVTFGDSIAVVGDKPFFPSRLQTLFGPLVEIENVNVAVGGSTSPQWLPGSSFLKNRVMPHLGDADLLVVTLGGNDLLHYMNSLGPAALSDIPGTLQGAHLLVGQIMENMLDIVSAIRDVNPDLDIVYCLYPNYGQATTTNPWNLVHAFLGPEVFLSLLDAARAAVPLDGGIHLADMFGAFEGLDLDEYLYDALHMNHAGATLYAETVFTTLGGVLVGPSPLEGGHTPLGLDKSFSLMALQTP